jgi:hypothetical protein
MRLKTKYPGVTLRVSREIGKLIKLIREGKLFAVQEWIKKGKSISSRSGDTSPLQEAVVSGFHSMAEVLLDAGVPQKDKDDALYLAVFEKRLPFIELLVGHGASIGSVEFSEVCNTDEMEIVDYFISHGASLIEGNPLERSLIRQKRTGLEVFQAYHDECPELQAQVDWALRHAIFDGNQDWITAMLDAGANPRAILPSRDNGYDDVALRNAVIFIRKDLDRFKIDREQDNLEELLADACHFGNVESTRHLLGKGANPNGVLEGRSILGIAIHGALPISGLKLPSLDCVWVLIEAGGKWLSPTKDDMKDARRLLCSIRPSEVVDLILLMCERQILDRAVFKGLTSSEKVKAHLTGERHRLEGLRERFGF